MRQLNRANICVVISITAVIDLAGCNDDPNAVPPRDASVGTDTGTGVGSPDTDTWDTTPLPGPNLMPNEEGFLKKENNSLGLQGAWYTFGCDGTVVTPARESTFFNDGRMCFSGTAPQVIDLDTDNELDYSTIWGAGMGFDTCVQSAEEAEPGAEPVQYPLGECPYNANLVEQFIGVSVRIRGHVNAAELRILFNEGISVANSYYIVDPADVAAGNVINVEFESDLVATHYDPDLKPGGTKPEFVLAIQFQVPTNDAGPVDWDFCVEAISAITAQ